jgi:outer membrane receptor protein involved in Fe transport
MGFGRRPIWRAHASLLVSAAILPFGFGITPATAADTNTITTVEVTGQRTTQGDPISAAPTSVIGSEALALSSTTTLENALQTVPSIGYQGMGAASSGGFGVYFVDLRSLNFNRTLTLVDGQRFVLSGIKTDEAVDLNNVPISLIDHIEIRPSGSEPIYGADAVAGTVNVVLKKDFDGFQITGYGGITNHSDDTTGEITATWGRNFRRGNLTFNIGYFQRDPIRQIDRDWSRNPVTDASIGSGHISETIGSPATPGGHAVSADGTIDDQVTGPGQSHPFDAASDSYNFAGAQYLQGSLQRATANLLGSYEISNSATASFELLASNRVSDTQAPPQTLGLAGTANFPDGFVVPAGNPYNFFGQDVELQRVLTEAGPLKTRAEGLTWRGVAKLEGEAFGRINWSLSYNHGQSRTSFDTRNSINLAHAIDSVSPGCATIAGCVAGDFFGPDSLSTAAVDWLRYTDRARSNYTEDVAEFSLGAQLFKLPGGPVSATLGGEWRKETGYTHFDAVTNAGDQATPDTSPTDGAYTSKEAYLDIEWPLLAGLPLVKSLDMDTSARYSSFDIFGPLSTWKVSLSYAPVDDIRFRATMGLARRVPAITEAFAGLSANLTSVQDPCDSRSGELANPVVAANCLAAGVPSNFVQNASLINIASGGNRDLIPESSKSTTLGTVLTPQFLPDLNATIDYYKYKIDNAIDSLADTDANFIPDTCYESINLSSPLCGLIQRTASGPNAGQINRILGLDENLGRIETDGFDFDVAYNHQFGGGLVLSVDWKSNLLLSYKITEDGETTQYAGSFASLINVGSYTHFKSLMTATLKGGPWTVGWRVHYIGGASVLGQDPAQVPFASAPVVWYHDLVASYRYRATIFTVGADNVLDRKPPQLLDGISNTDLNTYDPDGVFVYARVTRNF